MARGGVLGNGLKVAYSTNVTTPIWVPVLDIISVDKFFSLVSPKIDTAVSGDAIKGTMPGIPDSPEVSFTILLDLDPATSVAHEALRTNQISGADLFWLFERPTNRARTSFRAQKFVGYILSLEEMAPLHDKQTAKATVSYSSGYVITAPGASLIA